MIAQLFIILLVPAYVLGQVARVQFGQGVAVTLLDITVILFVILSIIHLFARRRLGEMRRVRMLKPAAIFVGACILSLLINSVRLSQFEFGVAGLYLLRFICYVSTVVFIANFSLAQKKRIVKMMGLSMIAAVGIGFMQYFYYPNLRNLYYLEWDDHLYRMFSVYLDPNFAGVLFACLFLLLSGYVLDEFKKQKRNTFFLSALSFLTLLAVFLTYSRSGFIALATGTAVFLLLKGYRKLLIGLLVLFGMMVFLTADTGVEGLNPFRTVSTNARLESMRIAVAIFQKNPVFGVGFNAYRYAQHEYGFRPDDKWQTSHADAGTDNSFLFVLATTGSIGFMCYLYFWYAFMRNAYIYSGRGRQTFPVIVISTGSAVLTASLFLNTVFYPFILLWVLSLYGVMEKKSP
ncbi:MAG: hypothetical protein RLZZ455_1059 [Candidatus Parcubacteria bacterium]|jgi:O-antigen ligase